jgi:PEP-CTERM motif
MRKISYTLIVLSLLLFPLIAHSNTTTTIVDDNANGYWGGTVTHTTDPALFGDVIGNPNFSVAQMVVTQVGNLWTVALSGDYFLCYQNASCDSGLARQLGPGDLYISTNTYSATGTGPNYNTDTFSRLGEGWNFVVPFIGTTNTPLGLYNLGADPTMTNVGLLNPSSYYYRDGQAWRGGATGSSLGLASVGLLGNTLTFQFDGTNLPYTGTLSFHWAMECGNDVVEGQVLSEAPPVVPEPSTLLLLGLGLTGVVAYKKIRG